MEKILTWTGYIFLYIFTERKLKVSSEVIRKTTINKNKNVKKTSYRDTFKVFKQSFAFSVKVNRLRLLPASVSSF